ncbi:hypothetical protein [Methylorubrum thiocyanatum]
MAVDDSFDQDNGEEAENILLERPRLKLLRSQISEVIPCDPEDIRSDLVEMPLPDLIFRYLNWADRFVRPRPRRVVTWEGFWRHSVAGEHMPAVTSIAAKIEAGEDLKPHLSDRVDRCGYVRPRRLDENNRPRGVEWGDKDYALNSYEVHHLHLKATGSRDLLYVAFSRDEAFFLLVGDHNSFDDGRLARALAEARAGTSYEIRGIIGLDRETSERERNRLQRAGISTISPNGTGHFVMGAMLTGSGMNGLLAMHGNRWMHAIAELEPQLDDAGFGREWFERSEHPYPEKPSWEWTASYCDLILAETTTGSGFTVVQWRR